MDHNRLDTVGNRIMNITILILIVTNLTSNYKSHPFIDIIELHTDFAELVSVSTVSIMWNTVERLWNAKLLPNFPSILSRRSFFWDVRPLYNV